MIGSSSWRVERCRGRPVLAVRGLAQSEGRRLRSLVDEALADLIDKRKQEKPRAHVMAAYQASHDKFGVLYKKLAE